MSNRNFKYICLFLTVILVLIGLGSLSAADTGDNVTLSDTPSLQADTISTQDSITTVSEQPTVSDQPKSTKKISETKTVNKKKINSDTTQKQTVKTNTTKVIKQETATTVNNYDELVNTINTATDDKITINLNTGTYTSTQTITLETQTAKDITINGNTQTIDANKQQFLNIADGYTITLKDLTITNAKSEQGGAIENNGDLTLTKVTFKDNTATNNGGAIYSTGTLNIQESVFTGNNVTSTNGAADHGGAAITALGQTTINNTLFKNNTGIHDDTTTSGSGAEAGAILILNNIKEVTIGNSTFANNTARYGGAISVNNKGENNKITIDNNIFENNTSLFGGAILVYSQAKITNSNFTNNTVKGVRSDGGSPVGGAIDVIGGNAVIEGSIFTNNTASNNGTAGAIGSTDNGVFTVNNSTFINNTADNLGGALYSDNSNINVNNSHFTNNSAAYGGAILGFENGTIANSTFTSNNASMYGGVLYTQTGNFNITNNTFTSNNATQRGGVIYTSIGNYTITNNTFTKSYSDTGGIIAGFKSNIKITDNNFTNNKGGASAGIYFEDGNLTSTNNNYTFNNATHDGGAIQTYDSKVTIINDTFTNNTARIGGAIYGGNYGTNISIENTTFTNNTAGSVGGAVYNQGNATIRNTTFTNNTANNTGGAISNSRTLKIDNSTFINNTVTNTTGRYALGGAAVYAAGVTTINNTIFTNNTAACDTSSTSLNNMGGAIYLLNSDSPRYGYKTARIENSTFTNNSALYGGAIATNGYHILNLKNNTFTNNNATYGGAVSNNRAIATVTNTTFINNTATNNGGAIYSMQYGTLTVKNSTFTGNNVTSTNGASSHGGAAITSRSKTTINNTLFANNTAAHNDKEPNGSGAYAGAIQLLGNTQNVTIANSTFDNNTARYGGAISVNAANKNVNVTIDNNKFTNNSALYGGAVVAYCQANITNSNFTDNTVKGEGSGERKPAGGAVSVIGGKDVLIENNTFTGNNASDDGVGGAVSITDEGNITINNSTFIRNNATYGGAVYNDNYTTVNNSRFINNTATQGGAIQNSVGNITIGNSTFVHNNATFGGTFVSYGNQTIINNVFRDNVITGTGGVIYTRDGTSIEENNIYFNNTMPSGIGGVIYTIYAKNIQNGNKYINNSANRGGVIYIVHSNVTSSFDTFTGNNATYNGAVFFVNGNLTVKNDTFSNNTAGTGGVIYTYYANITSINSTYTNNTAKYDAGTIYLSRANINSENDTFTNNTARSGGVLYNLNVNGETVKILNATMNNNSATSNGGAICSFGTMSITNSTLYHNNATQGGAIYSNNILTLDNTTFTNNTAKNNGGAIYNNNRGTLTVNNSTFTGNNVTSTNGSASHGGAAITTKGETSINNTIFANNTAAHNDATASGSGSYAGAIQIVNSTKNITIANSTFDNNTARYGGAISVNNVNENVNVTIDNNKFMNNSALFGGAIVAYSPANITNSNFTNNTVKGKASGNGVPIGGAICVLYKNAKIEGSIFTNNTANNRGYGGAIGTTDNAVLTLNNSTFTNNTADKMGGAVYLINGNQKITNNIFTNNTANLGGAVYSEKSSSTITNNNFTNNTARNAGGAIYSDMNTLTSSAYNNFTNNNATNDGGAIYVSRGNLTVINDTYINNTAKNGGAISGRSATGYVTNFTVENATFNNNTASANGGALYNQGNSTITNTTFSNNTANYYGGAIFNRDALSINNSTITGNNATKFGGAAVYVQNNLTVNNTNFINNTVTYNDEIKSNYGLGGAIYIKPAKGTATADIENSTFTNNTAYYGGAIYNYKTKLTVTNTTLDNNTVKCNGGAIYSDETGTLIVNNSTFTGNNVTSTNVSAAHGGAAIITKGETSINNTIFANNTAAHNDKEPGGSGAYAGAIQILNNTKEVTIGNSTFDNNTARYGGAIVIDDETKSGSTPVLDNNTFINNSAVYGGAVVVYSPVTVNNSNFTDNTVKGEGSGGRTPAGGAIAVISGSITLENSTFKNNTALDNGAGGAVYVEYSDMAHINNDTFTANSATASYGGAIYSALSDLSVNNTTFTDNNATHGGAIFAWSNATTANTTIANSTFTGNNATTQIGGAIYAQSGNFTVEDSTFTQNKGSWGGAIFNTVSNLTVRGNTYNNNTANNGGAIYTQYGNITSVNNTYNNNTANSQGGAIYAYFSNQTTENDTYNNNTAGYNGGAVANIMSNTTITNATINNSTARIGGAIFNYGNTTIADSTIENNTATNGAGAIYTRNGNMTITNTTLNNNNATVHGGAIYNYGNLTINNTNLTNNNALTGYGGAIYNNEYINANLTIGNSTVRGNTQVAYGPIYRYTTKLSVDSISDVKFNKVVTITGKLISENTGISDALITVTVNGETYNAVTNEDGIYTIKYVPAILGENKVTVSYAGNETYNKATSVTTTFTGLAHDTRIILNPTADAKYDTTVTITGTLLDTDESKVLADTIVTVKVNDNILTPTTDENGNFKVEVQAALKENTVTVNYAGNESYNKASEATSTFNGLKHDTTITIDPVSNIKYGQKVTVTGTLTDADTNTAITNTKVTINGEEVAVGADGKFSYEITATQGVNTVTVSYIGSDNYNTAVSSTQFNGLAHDTTVTVDKITDVKYGETVTVTGTLTDTDTDNTIGNAIVNIAVNGETYTAVTDSTGKYSLSNIPAVLGTNEVIISYNGNSTYNKATDATTTFNGLKHDTTITIDTVNDVKYGQKVTVTGTLTDADTNTAIANTKVTINGEEVSVDNNGKFSYEITSTLGVNEVTVTYPENDNYNTATETTTFNGLKHDTIIIIDTISDVKYGQDTTVTGTLRDANGDIIDGTVTVNGVEYTTINGVFTASVNAVLGTNTVTVTYADSTNYNGVTATSTFNGLKHDTTVTVDKVTDAKYGETTSITGKVTDADTNNAISNAIVTVTVNDKVYTTATNAEGVYTISNVPVVLGENKVTVSYNGDNSYNKATDATTIFNGLAHDTVIILDDISDVKYGETVTVTGILKDANGLAINGATVLVNDNPVTTDSEGKFTYTLTAELGLNTVNVNYVATGNYNSAQNSKSFNGLKHSTSIIIDPVSDVTYGTAVTVTGTLMDTDTNTVIANAIVKVNGQDVTTTGEGKFSYDVTADLNTNTVTVSYAGDINYEEADNAVVTFNGLAHDTVITLDNIEDVLYGDEATVTGTLSDVNGNLIDGATVTVNGNSYTTVNGVFTAKVTAALGVNTVTVSYAGDTSYNKAGIVTATFNGLKHDTIISLDSIDNVLYGEDATVTGTLKDANGETIGNAIVVVNGKEVTTDADGKFTAAVTADLEDNTVTVNYRGDNSYNAASATATFNGLAHDTVITLNNIADTLTGSDAVITGTLSDVNGNPINGATVTVNGNSYTTVNGVFTATATAALGVNTVTVDYAGNGSYNKASTVTATFNGLKHDTVLSVEEVTDSLYDNTVTVTGKLSDADGTLITGENIIVTVNGIEYPTTTGSNGTYTVTNIPVVLLQNIVSVSYNGNDALYNKAGNVTTTFNGLAHDTVISVDPIDSNIKSGDNISITGTLSDVNNTKVADAVITVTVNGNNYIVVTGQTGEFIVDNVPVILGSNSIVVTYNGNASYNKAGSETSFIGLAHDVTITVDPVSDTLFDNFVSVTGKLSNIDNTAITGADIIVNVNGNDYTATTDNDGVYAVNNIPVVLGVNNVTVTYDGNTAYNKVVTTTTFNGLKHNTALTVNPVSDTLYDNTVDITGSVVDANGTVISGAEVTVTVNGNKYITATDASGEYIIRNVDVIPGINSIDVVYAGNSKYVEAESVSLTFNGLKHATKVIINPVNDKLFDGKVTVNGVLADVNLTVIPDAILTVTVNGNSYTTTTSADGVYVIDVPVTIGENIISVIYDGSEVFTNSSSTITVNGLAHNTTLSVNPVSDVLFDETAAVIGKLTDANNTPISNADVTVTVNGVDYIVITDATGVYTVENVQVIPGVNTVTVTYNGNTSYNKADIITTTFNGLAHDTKLSVNPINNTLFDNTVTVTGLLHDANATLISGATVIITAGNNTYTTATGADGVYAINIPVTLGVNSIVVSYNGNSTFNMADNVETSFNGLAHDVIVTVNPVSDTLFDNTVTVTGSVTDVNNTPVSGQTVIVNINGKDYTAVTGNNGVYTVTDVPAVLLQNFVYVTSIADDMYNKADTVQTSFNGLAHDTIISVDPISDARIAENTSITGQLLDANNTPISGAAVIVTVNNIEYPAITGSDGRYIVNVPVTGKTNTVTAVYNGNISYNKAATSTATAFTGLTRSANITVNTITDTLYDNTVTVTGLLHDENTLIADADITVNVNGIDYSTVTDKNGMYSISNIPVSLGTNNVLVTYNGDDTYNKAETGTAFTGLKHDTIITLNNVDNVLFDNETIITGTLTDINGSLINGAAVTVNGKTYTTDNGVFNARIVAVRGVNIINVNYNGSEAYNTALTSTTFTGLKHDTIVSVDKISDVLYDDTVTVTGTVNDANNTLIADAVVEVTVNGNTYITATDTDGRYTLINIPASTGTNTVTVSYNGDDTYNKAVSVQGVFNGLPHDTVLTVNPVSDALYDDTVTVTGQLLDANNTVLSDETITVIVNGNSRIVSTDTNGIYTINNIPVVSGVNNIIISYDGSDKYNKAVNIQTSFNGLAHDTTLTVEHVNDTLYDNQVTITGKLTDANNTPISSQTIDITANTINYETVTNQNGIYTINVPVSLGINTVVVTFNGNDRYNKAVNAQTSFNGLKHDTTLTVEHVNDTLYDSQVAVTGLLHDANNTVISGADVTVTVNENSYTISTDTNGKYSVNVPVSLGINTVVVTFNVNDRYNKAVNAQTSFNGLKHDTTLAVEHVNDTLYDNTVIITGKLSDINSTAVVNANITVTVNGKDYPVTTDANGVYAVNVNALPGSNNVVVTFNGNDEYNRAVNAQTSFNGLAHDVTISMDSINDTLYDSSVIVTGKLADVNATAIANTIVTVVANGVTYYANTDTNGIYTVNIPVIAGVNTVVVSYGNDAYKQTSTTSTFNGLAHGSNVTIESVNTADLTNIVITGKVNDANTSAVAGANVTVTVNNVDYNASTDANGVYTVSNISAIEGVNNVVVTFNGNDIYNTSTVNTTFIGYKYNTTVTVDPVNAVVYDDVSIIAHVTDENNNTVTGGYVIFKVNGVTIKDTDGQAVRVDVVNGRAVLNTTATRLNVNTTTVSYSGNSLYNPSRANGTVDIAKRNATINLTVLSSDLKPGHMLIATAHVTDANGTPVTVGKVTFKLNGVTLKYANGTKIVVDVINGTAILNYTIPSTYSAKTYNLSAVFGGDVYNRVETSQNITVNRIDSYIEASNTTLVDNVLHVRATLRNNETKAIANERPTKVSVKINGKTVIKEARILDGVIDLNTTVNVKSGNHTVEIVTSGNNIYKPVRTSITVTSQTTAQVNSSIKSSVHRVNNNQTLLKV